MALWLAAASILLAIVLPVALYAYFNGYIKKLIVGQMMSMAVQIVHHQALRQNNLIDQRFQNELVRAISERDEEKVSLYIDHLFNTLYEQEGQDA